MTPQALLAHLDAGTFWPADHGVAPGVGPDVMDGPLHALRVFLADMAAVPGNVVTIGTWTDAQDIAAGQAWRAGFDAGIGALQVTLR